MRRAITAGLILALLAVAAAGLGVWDAVPGMNELAVGTCIGGW